MRCDSDSTRPVALRQSGLDPLHPSAAGQSDESPGRLRQSPVRLFGGRMHADHRQFPRLLRSVCRECLLPVVCE